MAFILMTLVAITATVTTVHYRLRFLESDRLVQAKDAQIRKGQL